MNSTKKEGSDKGTMIERVNSECSKTSYTTQALMSKSITTIILFSIAGLMLYILIDLRAIALATQIPEEVRISNYFALVAIAVTMTQTILAFPQIWRQSTAKELTNWYYERLLDKYKYPESDRPYLKALIKMKCHDFDVSLSELYNNKKTKSLFEDDELMEQFYESYDPF